MEQALRLAGNNRSELEKVLRHYSSNQNDSLKYRSTIFLIENLPEHYSYKFPEHLDLYYNEIDTAVSADFDNETNRNTMERISRKYEILEKLETIPDIQIITADYLIDNIDRAFDVWQNGEWATHISFDDFCEYILPYKGAELQPLDNWREYGKEMLTGEIDRLHYCDLYKNSAYRAATTVSKEIIKLNRQYLPFGGIHAMPVMRVSSLAKLPFGSCGDYALLAMAVMRSKGIPVVKDFTPQWAFQPQAHAWNVVLNNRGKNMIFSAGSSNPGEVHIPDEKMAKVFRHTYAINREILELQRAEKYIPSVYKNPFFKDITDEYMQTTDVVLEIPKEFREKSKYAYLAVFNNVDWIPVHFGKINGNKVIFKKMGKNCMYMPVLFGERGVEPFAAPFYITVKGEIKHCQADHNNLQTIIVRRKYFVGSHTYDVGERMQYGKFQAANKADFSDSLTIFTIPIFTVQSAEVPMDTVKGKYRYWRYCSPYWQFGNVAEIYFYHDGQPIRGEIIGTEGSKDINRKEVAFDGDPLTLFDSPQPNGSWVGMDFGKPINISSISYIPRGDGNDITPGDLHELLYWDKHQWISLGKRKVDNVKLIYENVPTNALFWIRNHSRGRDERIFTYENEQQVWW
ncbi:hypothetical protein AGMMS50262_06490 [Bacteroidia bacterium]|nr:hypothetical protein AGMMS50262_06490 [Bacteroidia bacterium]